MAGKRRQGTDSPVRAGAANGTTPMRRRFPGWAWIVAVVLLGATVAIGARTYFAHRAETPAPPPTMPAAARFVGSEACSGCHADQAKAWQGSHHAAAMRHATPDTVLGDFGDVDFEYAGTVSRFFRRGARFFVRTEGADGKLADFEVRYTMGFRPLQQYLVQFPDGRLQSLPFAWDAREKAQGGQRWYHLYAGERVLAGDALHWTGPYQNWNWMCADCHTTNLDRNYDAGRNRYATAWSEMGVGCEACHGPGSNHVAWAGKGGKRGEPTDPGLLQLLDERKGVAWLPDTIAGTAKRSKEKTSQREVMVCAQCHSRRAPMAEGMDHDGRFSETHDIALLDRGLYFDDGQQREEVYEVGSFLQSRMHAAGVSCSDCHEPHSGELRAPGNATCGQCHSAAKYDVREHTMHAAGSAGSACVDCHMPSRTYMGIDDRRDHSLRIPHPAASASVDAPDACTACHRDQTPAWAASAISRHFGRTKPGWQTFGNAFHAANAGKPEAAADLLAVIANDDAPGIARATALAYFGAYLGAGNVEALRASLRDPDPMVRGAAVEALQAAPADVRRRLLLPLAADPSRLVRIKAARILADAAGEPLAPQERQALETAFAEFEAAQRANADRPEARVALGAFFVRRAMPNLAEIEYRAAMALAPAFIPAYLNLADLYRESGREGDVQAVLDAGLKQAPRDAALMHAMGLLRVRQGRLSDALPWLEDAARAAPGNPRYAYVQAVALHEAGRSRAALDVLERTVGRFPDDREILGALAEYANELGDAARARRYRERLDRLQASPLR